MHRKENNGTAGRELYQEEVDWDAVDHYSSRVNGWGFSLLVDLPASEEGPGA